MVRRWSPKSKIKVQILFSLEFNFLSFVAQWLERIAVNYRVIGSNPIKRVSFWVLLG